MWKPVQETVESFCVEPYLYGKYPKDLVEFGIKLLRIFRSSAWKSTQDLKKLREEI
jgi:hypothetical protein